MKYLAVLAKCSEDTYKKVASDVSHYLIDSEYNKLPYIYCKAPKYVDEQLILVCTTSSNRYATPKNEYIDKMIEILSLYTNELDDFKGIVIWSGTDSKNGYFYHLYTDEGTIKDSDRVSIAHDMGSKMDFVENMARTVVGDYIDCRNDKFGEVYNLIYNEWYVNEMENVNIDDIPVSKYKLYGMDEDDFCKLSYKLGYGYTTVDYDMGLPQAIVECDGGKDVDCEDIFAKYLNVDARKVYAFTSDTDQSFPNDIMFIVME